MKSHLKQIRKELGLTQDDLAKILNCSKANISMIETGKSSLTEKNKKWLVQNLNINPRWLDGEKVPILLPAAEDHPNARGGTASESIPLYDLEKIPGLTQLFRCKGNFKPSGYISIPHFPKCDGAVSIAGDSMNPILRSGDLILYSQLAGTSEIFWGDMYLISVETSAGEYIAVRYIRKSEKEGMAVLAGENPAFAETEVELSKIRAVAFVKASIRMNSSK